MEAAWGRLEEHGPPRSSLPLHKPLFASAPHPPSTVQTLQVAEKNFGHTELRSAVCAARPEEFDVPPAIGIRRFDWYGRRRGTAGRFGGWRERRRHQGGGGVGVAALPFTRFPKRSG